MKLLPLFLLLSAGPVCAESFETASGAVTSLKTSVGTWSAAAGQATIQTSRGHSGNRSLRLDGKGDGTILLELKDASAPGTGLTFFAERWTKREPFNFAIEAKVGSAWKEIHRSAKDEIKVGGFLANLQLKLPTGTQALRFHCKSDADGGVLLDDVLLTEPGPMTATLVETTQPVCPAMVRATFNPVLGFRIDVKGSEGSAKLEGLEIGLDGTTTPTDVESLKVFAGSNESDEEGTQLIAESTRTDGRISLTCDRELLPGENWFWISPTLKATSSIDGRIDASLFRIKVGGKELTPQVVSPEGTQRIGVAIRLPGDDGSKAYRIPGLVRTKKGSLLAVYDVRYNHSRDLPADIDVGVSRSTDGGRNWEPMKIALDMGKDPAFGFDGVGDPCTLVDEVTGRIWIAGSWSHGKFGWHGSGPGLSENQTSQFMMTFSDDDGLTWSKPRNLTKELKDPAWRLFFQGPGAGITLKDGTLVMPAQFRSANGGETQGKPFSTLIWSKDRGETWTVGTGVKISTTEAQLIQLEDGSIMINCRDDRGGSRTIAVTKDLGKTWTLHSTDRKALREPVCMGSLFRWQHPKHGDLIFFSNPDATDGRHQMTVKLSRDQAMTWPEREHRLYDSRGCFGYSCLAIADSDHLGLIYEGNGSMLFLRLPLSEWSK